MGLARDAVKAITLATTAGLAIGGVIGVLAPSFAEAGPAAPTAQTAQTAQGRVAVQVTSVDLLGRDRLEVTVRFTNTGRAVERIDTADLKVTADGAVLPARNVASADVRPGGTVDETVVFDVPPALAGLTLTLPDGSTLPLT